MMAYTPQQLVTKYEAAKTRRVGHEADWRLAAAYCLPGEYSGWQTQNVSPMFITQTNAQVRRMIYDSTGARSLPKYQAILERLATPNGIRWQKLRASDTSLMRKRRVKEYFDEVTDLLAKERGAPNANFRTASNEVYAHIGAYGNGPIFVGRREPNALNRRPGAIYRSYKLHNIFWSVNNQGQTDTVYRRYWLNCRLFRQEFGDDMKPPPAMEAEMKKPSPDENRQFEFVQVIYPRTDDTYYPDALDARRFPFCSVHIAVTDKMQMGGESGFNRPPILTPRSFTMSEHEYGAGPAVMALASLGGASAIKKTHLKQGNLAGDPVILTADDGALNGAVDLRPGHVNPGGISHDGKKMIDILPTGNFQINENLLDGERADIEDSFLVSLFQLLSDESSDRMTIPEVMQRIADRAALLSPTMGRLQTEFLGPLTEREIDVHTENGIMPDMPPELIEAQGEYTVQYTSPMAKGEYAEEIAGFTQILSMTNDIVIATQDPSPYDHYNFDVALPEIAEKTNVPTRWMSTDDEIAAKRDTRAKQTQQDQLMKNAPALASAAKTAAEMQNGGRK